MSRLKRYTHSLASGYAALLGNVLFSLLSVPIAMHYLSNEEFGLWVVVAQVSGYLALVDFGMSGSIARILIDHKDNPNDGIYGAVIKTGALVLLIQGLVIALLGLALGHWLAKLFDVPTNFVNSFRGLVSGQSTVLGLTFAGRIFGFVLQAHQRYDILNYSQLGNFALNLLVLWLGFVMKLGVYSLLLASAVAMVFSALFTSITAQRLRLMPSKGTWGKSSWTTFRELFLFGTDIFLIFIGQQLLSTAQVLVVSRMLGLEAAAVWSVATKAFALAQQIVSRFIDFTGAAFSEMVVRGERERLHSRFRDVVILTASVSIVAGFVVALCNSSFLQIWTRGRIAWDRSNDYLMAAYIAVYSTTRCYIGLIMLTKEIRALKYVYLLEGTCFVVFALIAAGRLGFGGVIASGILTSLVCSGAYGVRRLDEYLGIKPREMILAWLRFPFRLCLVLCVAAAVLWWLTRGLSPIADLSIKGTTAAIIGTFTLWQLGLPLNLQQELRGLVRRVGVRLFARGSLE